jgi:hypothetical protein
MQGSFSNIVRLMPQEEALVASLAEPEKIRKLALHIAGMIAQIIRAFRAAGEGGSLRARLRLPPPPGVKGLFVDDYVSVLRPADFLSLNIDAYRLMADAFDGTFLHTCGPVSQCAGILPELPGIVGFETCFVEKQHKTTDQLEKLKAGMYNRIVVGSFALPFGQPVEDMENLTGEWLRKMSRGGGFMMQSSGTAGEAAGLAEKLKL